MKGGNQEKGAEGWEWEVEGAFNSLKEEKWDVKQGI